MIYDENAEIEFISKYEGYRSENFFLRLEAKIKNIQDKYDEQPFAETLKEAEIKEVSEKFNRKSNRKRC